MGIDSVGGFFCGSIESGSLIMATDVKYFV